MKNARLLSLALLLAVTFTLTGGGFAPAADAAKPGGTSVCAFSYCQVDSDCREECCPRYGCDEEGNFLYGSGCWIYDPALNCGICVC